MGTGKEIRGAEQVAQTFAARPSRSARTREWRTWSDLGSWRKGACGVRLHIVDGKVARIEMIADPDRLFELDLDY